MKISSDSLFSLMAPSKTADTAAREDRLKAAAEARLREARAAAETLKSRSSQASEDRKAAARQKVEQLKARLQMLRSMASVDPKGTARLAAQLARELGSAVKAYAAAGGNASGMTGAGVAAVPASGETGAAEGAQAAAAPGVPQAGSATADQASTEEGGSGQTGDGAKPPNPYQQAVDEQQAQAAEMARRSGQQKADTDFMADVRRMAAELKALVRAAIEKAKAGEDDALSPQEASELEKTVAAMDREIGQAGADLGGGLGGGLVSLLV